MNTQLLYIETFGCQMNERDSEIMGQLLSGSDYKETSEISSADLILVNTCSIREKAEQKVYSLLGRLSKYKKRNSSLIITVAGCVAQQEGSRLPSRMPQVDIVIGTQNIYRLPELVKKVKKGQTPQVAIDLKNTFEIPPYSAPASPAALTKPSGGELKCSSSGEFKKFVTIMQGCNNYCSYCVVPHTRGREVSRSIDDIITEVGTLASSGIKEITLIGQNVNSYGLSNSSSQKDSKSSFTDLLRAVAGVNGIERIRFTTSHPKDLSEELMRCFSEIDKLCPHFHLPVQSGSNRILKLMNRKYAVEEYLDKVNALRSYCPDVAVSTDIIVGFPGETAEDFEQTMSLLEKVRYHSAFSFKYSDRPTARSTSFDGKISEAEKSERLARLQKRQNEIIMERNREYIGSVVQVMVEGKSKSSDLQWQGRTSTNHIVNFEAVGLEKGRLADVLITEACQNSLRGIYND